LVAAVRGGLSHRKAARRFHVGLATVHLWVERAGEQRLDRVDWADRPHTPHQTSRTDTALEDRVLTLRRELLNSDLGHCGAAAIRQTLQQEGGETVPSLRTLGRILERRGALDARRRVRRPPPPRGWYLPEVAAHRAELDSFDIVEGVVIKGGPEVAVLNGISLHGGLPASWPMTSVSAKIAAEMLVTHWRQCGLPAYAQFDNDTIFQGAHQFADTVGRVTRLCLSLGVVPVFAPPRETGFQAMIENYNGWWEAKVWARFEHTSLAELQERSARYVAASRRSRLQRIEAAPPRAPFPKDWSLDLQTPPKGLIIYLRRANDTGQVSLLGRTFVVSGQWAHRLVRAEVNLHAECISFYSLRRKDPGSQSLLSTIAYKLPARRFEG
jgi:putative transposase